MRFFLLSVVRMTIIVNVLLIVKHLTHMYA